MAVAIPYVVGAIAAVGAVRQAQAASDAAEYNQKVARQNATIANQQSVVAQDQQRRQAQQRLGLMLANAGASGVENTGSVSDVFMDSARQAEVERQTIAYNYSLKASGYGQQADLYGAQASNASTSGALGLVGSVAEGFGKSYGRSYGDPSDAQYSDVKRNLF